MKQVSKATAALVGGAASYLLISIIGSFVEIPNQPEVTGAVTTLITAGLVYFAPANK